MPQLRLTHPELTDAAMPIGEFLQRVPREVFNVCVNALSKYYAKQLPIFYLLRVGGHDMGDGQRQLQIACELPDHGGADNTASARYYPESFTDGEDGSSSVYCFKCSKKTTSLWYAVGLAQRRGVEGGLKGAMAWLETQYGFPVPRALFLDFDIEAYYDDMGQGGEGAQALRALLEQALRIVKDKNPNNPQYLAAIKQIASARL